MPVILESDHLEDLLDTLGAQKGECVGMAANMIGERKRIIVVDMGFMNVLMYNPVIIKKILHMKQKKGKCTGSGVKNTRKKNWLLECHEC